MLEISTVASGYPDGPDVLSNVDLEVGEGEVVSLIGLNGAGKSTLVRTIAGILYARVGSIRFRGEDLTHTRCDFRCRRGLTLVPEGRELFLQMSVMDNLDLGTYALPRNQRQQRGMQARERVFSLFPALADRRHQVTGSLSGGQQQMVAIGRALMGAPKLLILDEPSLGLAPRLIDEIFEALRLLNADGLSILLVEQNANAAASLRGRTYVLQLGRCTACAGSATADLGHGLGVFTEGRPSTGPHEHAEPEPGLPLYSFGDGDHLRPFS